MYTTDQYEGMLAETMVIPGYHADLIHAYFARPLGSGPFPGVVLVHPLGHRAAGTVVVAAAAGEEPTALAR